METKNITLVNGGFTIVDADDYEVLSKFRWFRSRWGYAYRQGWETKPTGEKEHWTIWMHRVINKTPEGMCTDHANKCKLDNRKENLRTTDKSRNSANRVKSKSPNGRKPVSQFKGVHYNRKIGIWEARIHNRGRHRTTYHKSEEQAALDYNRMAKECFGEFASLNAIPEGTEPTVRKLKTSKYTGVTFHKRTGKWRAYIQIGHYDSEREAVLAYNDAATKIRGDRAKLNEID